MAEDAAGRRELLRAVQVLRSLDDSRLDALAALVEVQVAPAGHVIVHQGDPSREVYLLTSGQVEIHTDGRTVATLGAGAIIGEVALLADAPRMSTVVATTDAELLVLGADAFTALLDEPEIARVIAAELAQRLRAVPAASPAEAKGSDGGDTAAWDLLTPAEQQVARLVADGLTNGKVAEKLYLSRHTVESHLKHIFTKLGITSRVSLAVDVVPR